MIRPQLVSIIVPAFNESESLEELYERTRQTMEGVRPFEFIVVDDGSTDDTVDRLKSLRQCYPNIGIISQYRNHGKSLALMQGFTAARGDVVVLMDADLQDHPEVIPQFLEKIDEGYDLVNGWRSDRQDSRAKVFVSSIFNFLTSRLLNCPLHDINCGFKAIHARFYKRLELQGDLHRLIPAIVATNGGKVTEIPVPHSPRQYGQSRYRLLRHRGLLDIVALVARSATQFRPFHLACEIAFFFWLMAIVSLFGWIGLMLYGADNSAWMRILRPLIALAGVATASIGTLLPLFGFQMEVTVTRHNDTTWRRRLIKEKYEAKISDHEFRFDSESFSPARRFQTVLEPDLQSVLDGQGTAAR